LTTLQNCAAVPRRADEDLAQGKGPPQGSGFRVQGSGFRVQGVGCRVQGSRFRVHERERERERAREREREKERERERARERHLASVFEERGETKLCRGVIRVQQHPFAQALDLCKGEREASAPSKEASPPPSPLSGS